MIGSTAMGWVVAVWVVASVLMDTSLTGANPNPNASAAVSPDARQPSDQDLFFAGRRAINGGRATEGIALLLDLSSRLSIEGGLESSASSAVVLHDLALAHWHVGRPDVAKYILHQAVVYLAVAAMQDAQVAVLKALELDLQSMLLNLGQATHDAAAQAGPPVPPWVGQSRTRRPYTGDPSRIAVVSLCDYDPLSSPLTPLSASNKFRYTRKHGYSLFFETSAADPSRPPAWGKVSVVKKYLAQSDWVMWMDCDSFFMNDSLPLTDLLPDEATHPHVDVVMSEDGLNINTGVFMVRNTPWVHQLLDRWYGPPDTPFVTHPHWEQAAMQTMLTHSRQRRHPAYYPPIKSCVLGYDPDGTCGFGTTRPRPTHMAPDGSLPEDQLIHKSLLHPQRWMNSYPRELAMKLRDPAGRPTHTVFTPGEFIVSFSGCNYMLGPRPCWDLFDTYYDLSEEANQPADGPNAAARTPNRGSSRPASMGSSVPLRKVYGAQRD